FHGDERHAQKAEQPARSEGNGEGERDGRLDSGYREVNVDRTRVQPGKYQHQTEDEEHQKNRPYSFEHSPAPYQPETGSNRPLRIGWKTMLPRTIAVIHE